MLRPGASNDHGAEAALLRSGIGYRSEDFCPSGLAVQVCTYGFSCSAALSVWTMVLTMQLAINEAFLDDSETKRRPRSPFPLEAARLREWVPDRHTDCSVWYPAGCS